ncbi:unnamed protein product, partial [Ectocarpus sp. 6 AP-2014]
MKREAAISSNGTGSFFAFHSSAADNWHGILCLGIKYMSATGSEYMTHGAADGKGIYMTASPWKALAYTMAHSWVRALMKRQPRAALVPARAIATNAASASGCNTAANATSAVPAVTAFGGSLSTQDVSLRGHGGHGNSVKQSYINVAKVPTILAVCEVIDRPEYHRQGYFVTPDEDSVAT